jgi:hypothetical protein
MANHSPFPGMDPYLEADMWPDIHHTLATYVRESVAPQIAPKYVAKIEPAIVKDRSADQDIGIMYPDVALLEKQPRPNPPASPMPRNHATPATVYLPLLTEVEVRIPAIYIYNRKRQQLITAIEILSPVNKREPQLSEYRRKRKELRQSGVHLLEIDLIRRGQPPFQHAQLPVSDYRVILERADRVHSEIWVLDLVDPLPVLPVPLLEPDVDATFDLGQILRELYVRSYYHQAIDYHQDPPPPALSPEKSAWVKERTANR